MTITIPIISSWFVSWKFVFGISVAPDCNGETSSWENNSFTVDEIRVELDVGFVGQNTHLMKDNVREISVAIALFRGVDFLPKLTFQDRR